MVSSFSSPQVFFLLLLVVTFSDCKSCRVDINSTQIEWKLCHSAIQNNRYISFNNFSDTSAYQNECIPATVPGTALTSMLNNNLFDGITNLFDDDNLNKIPDIYNNSDMYTFFWNEHK